MDRDANRLAAVISGVLLVILFLIAGVSVKPFLAVEQEHVLYVGSANVTAFDHPVVLPSASKYQEGNGPVKTALGEWLVISPYDDATGTARWNYAGTSQEGEYVCRISWTTGYTVYLAGIGIFDGTAPWTKGGFTLIDARGPTDGRPNELHMPWAFRPDTLTNTTTR